jgi:hypothetical protein
MGAARRFVRGAAFGVGVYLTIQAFLVMTGRVAPTAPMRDLVR